MGIAPAPGGPAPPGVELLPGGPPTPLAPPPPMEGFSTWEIVCMSASGSNLEPNKKHQDCRKSYSKQNQEGGMGSLLQAYFNTTWEGGRGQVLQYVKFFP